jgi:hypothetical protein
MRTKIDAEQKLNVRKWVNRYIEITILPLAKIEFSRIKDDQHILLNKALKNNQQIV